MIRGDRGMPAAEAAEWVPHRLATSIIQLSHDQTE